MNYDLAIKEASKAMMFLDKRFEATKKQSYKIESSAYVEFSLYATSAAYAEMLKPSDVKDSIEEEAEKRKQVAIDTMGQVKPLAKEDRRKFRLWGFSAEARRNIYK